MLVAVYLVPFGQLVSNQEEEVGLWHILETAGNGQRERNAMLQLAPKYSCFQIRNTLASCVFLIGIVLINPAQF